MLERLRRPSEAPRRGRLSLAIAVALAACVPILGGCNRPAPQPKPNTPNLNLDLSPDGLGRTETPDFDRKEQYLIEHDRFLAVDDPFFVDAESADFLADDDEVFGLVINGTARAYSIRALSYHHVINDTFGDTPVAVAY